MPRLPVIAELGFQGLNALPQLVDVLVKAWGHERSPVVPRAARCTCIRLPSIAVQQSQPLAQAPQSCPLRVRHERRLAGSSTACSAASPWLSALRRRAWKRHIASAGCLVHRAEATCPAIPDDSLTAGFGPR